MRTRGEILVIASMLMLGAPAHAEEPINGRWAIDPQGCMIEGDTSSTAPLYVTDTTLKWFVASCRVGTSYKIGNALYIQARCSSEGMKSSTPVKLDLVSRDKLAVTWDRGKIEHMQRCK
jgi:hypothetical protein